VTGQCLQASAVAMLLLLLLLPNEATHAINTLLFFDTLESKSQRSAGDH